MGKRNTDPLPEEVDFLLMDVQEWRRTKAGPGTPMPTEIWGTAVRQARGFGVCRIARPLGWIMSGCARNSNGERGLRLPWPQPS